MVIVRLKGGLGNQLFQFACARAIAAYRKEQLFLDLIYLTVNPLRFIPRDFKLERLDNFEIADETILKSFSKLYASGNAAFVEDSFPKNAFANLLHHKAIKAILLDGYFQDEFYFSEYEELIRKEYTTLLSHYAVHSLMSLYDDKRNTVAVHVRRGDYLSANTLKVHGICELDYYQEAITLIRLQVSDPQFYIFSDDPELAADLFADLLPVKTNVSALVDQQDVQHKDLLEMAFMSKCRHFILANSSYSWWGSYLADSPSKLVIAPKRWFLDQSLEQLSDDIGLESWIRI